MARPCAGKRGERLFAPIVCGLRVGFALTGTGTPRLTHVAFRSRTTALLATALPLATQPSMNVPRPCRHPGRCPKQRSCLATRRGTQAAPWSSQESVKKGGAKMDQRPRNSDVKDDYIDRYQDSRRSGIRAVVLDFSALMVYGWL